MTECSKECGRKATRRGLCHTHYETHRIRQTAYGRWETLYVDAEPVRQHILDLKSRGMGNRRIAELSGVCRNNIKEVLTGRATRGTKRSERMLRRNAQAILAVNADPADRAYVDPCGTVRRLRALVTIGWTQHNLSDRMCITPRNSSKIFRGEQKYVTAVTAKRVVQIFDELQLTPGPSDRARCFAKARGWAPPLAWDEDTIDDPAAKPDLGEKVVVGFVERYEEMRDLGYNDLQIVARWDCKPQSLARQMHRYGMTPSPELSSVVASIKYRDTEAAS